MSQADDVRASLLASHDRDAVVRRKVADQVHEVVATGLQGFCFPEGNPGDLVGPAAAAVVLASDLRAPIPHGAGAWGPGDPMAERDEDGYYPTRIDTDAELAAASESAKAWMGRERLVAVQRLLGASFDAPTRRQSDEAVSDALSIVRSLLGGE